MTHSLDPSRMAATRAARKRLLADPLHPVTRMRERRLAENRKKAMKETAGKFWMADRNVRQSVRGRALTQTVLAQRGGVDPTMWSTP